VLSIYIIVTNLVTMGGQLMVNLAAPSGPALFTVAAILVCLSLVPLSLTPTATPKPIAEAKLRIAQLYKYSPSGFIGCLAFGLADGAFWSLAPVFADGRGMDVADITFVMSLFVVGGSISQWPLGHYSDKVDRRWVIALCCAGSLCTASVLAFYELDQRWFAYALACAHGAFMLPIYPLLLAHANDYAPNDRLVETSSGHRRAVDRRAPDADLRGRQPVLLHRHDPRPAAGLHPVPPAPPAGRRARGAGRVLSRAQDLALGLQSGDRRLTARAAARRQVMLYMVIEHFKGGDAKPVYRRFRDRGRLMPDGLAYVDSWVTSDCARCFQIVRCVAATRSSAATTRRCSKPGRRPGPT
jgi:hypothetical protein